MPAVVLPRADLPFAGSLPELQRLFPDDTACAAYLEAIRWRGGFVCGWCGERRAGMDRPGRDRLGGQPRDHVEIDESWVGGRTRGEGRGVHDQSLVIAAVEVRQRKPENVKGVPRRNGRYAGRIRMEVVPDR